jgi:hypothetical protein
MDFEDNNWLMPSPIPSISQLKKCEDLVHEFRADRRDAVPSFQIPNDHHKITSRFTRRSELHSACSSDPPYRIRSHVHLSSHLGMHGILFAMMPSFRFYQFGFDHRRCFGAFKCSFDGL